MLADSVLAACYLRRLLLWVEEDAATDVQWGIQGASGLGLLRGSAASEQRRRSRFSWEQFQFPVPGTVINKP